MLEDLAGHDGLIYSHRTLDPWRFRVDGAWRHAAPTGRRIVAGNGEVLRDAPEGLWDRGQWRVEVTDGEDALLFTVAVEVRRNAA